MGLCGRPGVPGTGDPPSRWSTGPVCLLTRQRAAVTDACPGECSPGCRLGLVPLLLSGRGGDVGGKWPLTCVWTPLCEAC